MNPNDFVTLAIRLSADSSESAQRSAVSRGYYGAFHQAKQLVESCGFQFSDTAETHEKLPWCMDSSDDTELKEVSRKLNTLRKMRNVADYDLLDGRFKGKAFTSIQLGEIQDVVDRLDRAKLRLSTFRDKIRAYAANVLRKALS